MSNTKISTNQINMGDITGAFFEQTKDLSAGKKTIAEALNAKGVPSSDTETLGDLAHKVSSLATDADILYGKWVANFTTGNFTTNTSIWRLETRNAVIINTNGTLYYIPQYGVWETTAEMLETATFRIALTDLFGLESTPTIEASVSPNGRYMAVVIPGSTYSNKVFLVSVNDDSFTLVDTYTLPNSYFTSTGRITAISNDGTVFSYSQYSSSSSYISTQHVTILGTSVDLIWNNASSSFSTYSAVCAIANTGNTYKILGLAPSSSYSSTMYIGTFLKDGGTLTKVDVSLTYSTITTQSKNPRLEIITDGGDILVGVVQQSNEICLKNFWDNAASWQVYKLGKARVPLFNNAGYEWVNQFIPKSFNYVDKEVTLDSCSLPLESVVFNYETGQVVTDLTGNYIAREDLDDYNLNTGTNNPTAATRNSETMVPLVFNNNKTHCLYIRGDSNLQTGYTKWSTPVSLSYYFLVTFYPKNVMYGYNTKLGGTDHTVVFQSMSNTDVLAGVYDYPTPEESTESI